VLLMGSMALVQSLCLVILVTLLAVAQTTGG
jgi:hypothetical protein